MSNVDKGTLKKRLAERIKAGQILNVIQDCALGKIEMSATQLNAARICLGKVLPDLKAVEQTIKDERVKSRLEIDARLKSFGLDPEEIWQSIERH